MLIFNAPKNHRLLPDVPEGQIVYGGQTFESENAEELLTLDDYRVSEAPKDLSDLTRSELDDLAEANGLDPSALSNKSAVIAALEAQSAADGRGQSETETEIPED